MDVLFVKGSVSVQTPRLSLNTKEVFLFFYPRGTENREKGRRQEVDDREGGREQGKGRGSRVFAWGRRGKGIKETEKRETWSIGK